MMVKVWCNQETVGDIRERQPKSPGQKPMQQGKWNMLPPTKIVPREVKWANVCKDGNARCTRCGHKGHDEVSR